jgi:UDP-N-acetylglucosamine:LPS N-acetylglucosamine transferase
MVKEAIRLRRSGSVERGRLRIVVLAPSEEPVPPRTYGGSELVAYNVTEELVRRGHEVYLIAAGTSQTSATLIPIAEKSFREVYANSPLTNCPEDYQGLRDYWNLKCAVEATAIIRSLKPDIVHNHVDWRGVVLQSLMPCPMITTVHNRVQFQTQKTAMLEYPQGNYVSISDNQRKDLPDANWVATT